MEGVRIIFSVNKYLFLLLLPLSALLSRFALILFALILYLDHTLFGYFMKCVSSGVVLIVSWEMYFRHCSINGIQFAHAECFAFNTHVRDCQISLFVFATMLSWS